MKPVYNSYSRYLKDRYGTTAYRVAVDGGFSCPHRGADRSHPGCTYCDEYGSRAPYQETIGKARAGPAGWRDADTLADRKTAVREQVHRGMRFLTSRYGAEVFFLYFQAFSGTYAAVDTLREIYDYGLALAPFRELIVSTRPDCIDEETADLLAGYRTAGRDVWVELGLQSASDETLRRINRGHTFSDFRAAFAALKDRGVKVAVHVIFGLPGEGLDAVLRTVQKVACMNPDGIKIHNLHIPWHTALLEEYRLGDITVAASPRHLEYVIRALEILPPETVVMRLTCDTPEERLALPKASWDKARFIRELESEMAGRETYQGRLRRKAAAKQTAAAEPG